MNRSGTVHQTLYRVSLMFSQTVPLSHVGFPLFTLGGDAKLLVMLCVSPAQRFLTETLQCLGFGSRARQVARGKTQKRRPTSFVPNNLSIGSYLTVMHFLLVINFLFYLSGLREITRLKAIKRLTKVSL